VVDDFDLSRPGPGLSEWLGLSEDDAWRARGHTGDVPEEWAPFHARALDELARAIDDAAE
jgi:hypothetical protein